MATGYDPAYRDRVSQALVDALFDVCAVKDIGLVNLRLGEIFDSLTDIMAFTIAAADPDEAQIIYRLLGHGFPAEVKRREKRQRKMLDDSHIAEVRSRH